MAASQAARSLALVLFLAWPASLPVRSQEPAPADTPPAEVLKNLGLAKSGTIWVLPDEKSVLRDLRDARDLYRQVSQGMMNQQFLAYAPRTGRPP